MNDLTVPEMLELAARISHSIVRSMTIIELNLNIVESELTYCSPFVSDATDVVWSSFKALKRQNYMLRRLITAVAEEER